MKSTGLYLTFCFVCYSWLSQAQVKPFSVDQLLRQSETSMYHNNNLNPVMDTFCGLLIDVYVSPSSCSGACDATIEILASGGTLPYTYWIEGDSCEGIVTVFVSDAAGCIDSTHVFIYSKSDLEIYNLIISHASNHQNNGTVEVEAGNGVPPYLYSIDGDNFQLSPLFSSLAPGPYCISIVDDNGCFIKTDTFWIENITSILEPIEHIALYPNPANSSLFVNGKTPFQLDLLDADGVVVKSSPASTSHTLDVADLPRGLYLVRMRNEIGFTFRKILLQ